MTHTKSVLRWSLVGTLLLAAGCGATTAAEPNAPCKGKCDSQLNFDPTPIPIPAIGCEMTEDLRGVACTMPAQDHFTAEFQIHAAPQKPPSAASPIGPEPTVIALDPEDFGKIKVLVRWKQVVGEQDAKRELDKEAFVSPEKPKVTFDSGLELWPIRVVSYDLAAMPSAYVAWKTDLHSDSGKVDLDPTGSDGLFWIPVDPEALLTMRAHKSSYMYSVSYKPVTQPGIYQIEPDPDSSSKLTFVPIDTLGWPDGPDPA